MATKHNTAIMEQVCKTANSLFPELNVRPSDLANPTEPFLVRILIHCLKAYGFRVDAPYNIDGDVNDSSKRIFLSKLCRQVQKILQISFPGKSYTYYDITNPTAKTTLNTLDVLLNYWCFYRMHKKNLINPLIERIQERQALNTGNAAKRCELEQQQQSGKQHKLELKECEESLRKLHEQLPQAKAENNAQSKALRQLQSEVALEEEQQAQLQAQINEVKKLVVADNDVAVVKMETEQLAAKIESCKPVLEKMDKIFVERRQEIEMLTQINEGIDKAFNIISPEMLNGYKECVKVKERFEKQHKSNLEQYQEMRHSKEQLEKLLQQSEIKLQTLKLECDEQAANQQQNEQEQQTIIDQLNSELEELQQSYSELQQQLEEEERAMENLIVVMTQLFV